ncbi:unannotated protein [freshwater metagenome]|uniref:Unannotated protein n=1 Tax=freshwater metagenome TaxID=449393 RepID=A0A6J7IG79_9ZZZZ|nr:FAD-binding protein [Actinomycetota bacterium]
MAEQHWDRVVDVVVVGSGSGAIAAAITAAKGGAEVEVIEKAEQFGGTSAWSGGMPWMPMNSKMASVGVEDSRADALTYIRGLDCDRAPDQELVETFVDNAATALDYLEANSALNLVVAKSYSDYFADRPGGKPRGRSLEPVPLDANAVLGDFADKVRDTPHIPRLTQDEMAAEGARRNLPISHGDVPTDIMALLAEREANNIRTIGPAFMSGLIRGALDAGVALTNNTAADQLVVENGEVVGVIALNEGREVRIGARRGVVLGCGGFEWNSEKVRTYLGVPDTIALSPPTNVGDGLQMGLEVGADVANMTNAVAFPSVYDEKSELEGAPFASLTAPRNDPGVIIVNRQGERFVNEGVNYMDVAKVHRAYDPKTASYPNQGPAWMVFDQDVRDRNVVMDMFPGQPTPEWALEAPTIGELAVKMGVDPAVLEQQVERWNSHVDAGEDPDFNRGTIWWEGFQIEGPSPAKNMRHLKNGPFYAVKLYNGILGTVGGLRINSNAQVRASRGGLVNGLYAVGNTAAGIFGQTYPGGGGTLGPNLTFGYLAGKHLSAQPAREVGAAAVAQG